MANKIYRAPALPTAGEQEKLFGSDKILSLVNKHIRPPALPTAGEQEKLFASGKIVSLENKHIRTPAVCVGLRRKLTAGEQTPYAAAVLCASGTRNTTGAQKIVFASGKCGCGLANANLTLAQWKRCSPVGRRYTPRAGRLSILSSRADTHQ